MKRRATAVGTNVLFYHSIVNCETVITIHIYLVLFTIDKNCSVYKGVIAKSEVKYSSLSFSARTSV